MSRGGAAYWFDFETVHDTARPLLWRRADDVRPLILTSLLRTLPGQRRQTLDLILEAYADDAVAHVLAATFTSVWRRSLAYDLLQAPVSFACFKEIGRLLRNWRMMRA